MTATLTPSTGRVRAGPPIGFNKRNYRPGERVLYGIGNEAYGVGEIDALAGLEGNVVVIDGQTLYTSKIVGRLAPSVDGAALLSDLAGIPKPLPDLTAMEARLAAEEAVLRRYGIGE